MKVYADIRQKVNINPIDILKNLRDKELGGYRNWNFEKDGKFYIGWEESAGSHSHVLSEEISKEKYLVIENLKSIINYMNKK